MLWQKKQSIDIPSVHLEGERIIMRPPLPGDYRAWRDVRAGNKDFLQPYEPLWPSGCLKRDFFERRLLRQYQSWQAGTGRYFLIFSKDNDVLIGGMNINHICRAAAQYASLGYWLDRNHQGKGYMAEALDLTLYHTFQDLRLHRVNASCVPSNKRSRNCLIRAGFMEEGRAVKYLEINGRWQDHILFGLPVENWLEH